MVRLSFISFACICCVMCAGTVSLWAAAKPVAFISMYSGDASADAVCDETVRKIRQSLSSSGRFQLIPESKVFNASQRYRENDSIDTVQLLKDLKADTLIVVYVSPRGGRYYGKVDIRSSKGVSATISADGRLMNTLPLLLEQKMLHYQMKIPVVSSVLQRLSKNMYVIDDGDSSGLIEGKSYSLRNGGRIAVVQTTHTTSLIHAESGVVLGDSIIIETYPDFTEKNAFLQRAIEREVLNRYAAESTILKGVPFPEKRFIESLLIINPLSNAILPAYGSYLSTGYMGFKNPEPSYPGLSLAFAMETYQLGYTSWETDRKGNFFPWKEDRDKNAQVLRYQRFLWGTLPVTWAVAYCDQLAYQYERFTNLPPGFENRDRSAVILSVLVPGGGLFYKGYRGAGWSFYMAEFSLAAYYVRHRGEKNARNALYGAAGVKLIEFISAYALPPSYRFFNDGMGSSSISFVLSMDTLDTRAQWKMGLTHSW